MPTYLYQVVSDEAGAEPEVFEVRQSMRDEPLSRHPATGEPVRRIVTGGFGLMKVRSGPTSVSAHNHDPGGCCGNCHG